MSESLPAAGRGACRSRRRLPTPVRRCALAAAILAAVATAACLRDPAPETDPYADPGARAARIETLRQSIDRDRARLEQLIAEPQPRGVASLYEDPEVTTIAERIGAQSRELAALESLDREVGP